MSRENAEFALEAFSKKMGIETPRFDQGGAALLAFGDQHELIFHYTEETDRLQIWSPLHDVMLTGGAEFDCAMMNYLLEKNFPASVLNGAYFAVDSDIGVVLLGCQVVIDTRDTDRFADTIMGFAQQVMAIAETITKDVSDALAARTIPDETNTDTPIIRA